MDRAIKLISDHLPAYLEAAIDRVIAAKIPYYERFARDELKEMIGRVFAAFHRDLLGGTVQFYPALFEYIGEQRAWQGVWIGDLIQGPVHGFDVISEHLERAFADDLEAQLWWSERRRVLAYAGVASLNEAFFKAREALIAEQNAHIQRLAAPIVPVARGVLVLPLVGVIDEARVEAMVASLLSRVSRDRAAVVIIDITGVAEVDTGVSAALGRAAQAARLLGAQVILVGISPDIAQTMVRMGISLADVTTLANLESGVAHALRLQGKAITER